ncbi:MAG: hypothetical protein GY794_11220, partial [bacterium]|nr:hypothetical protein [bacterium]
MDSDNGEDYPTDIYLHNPHSTVLTIEYETTSGSGTYTIPANSTVSFSSATGDYVPAGSGVYLRGNDVFWGVSTIDTSGGDSYDYGDGRRTDWGYSLVPAFLLDNEHFMGWAPGSTGGDVDSSGIFVSAVQDNIRLFIDFDNDGVADQTYDLDRLESQYIYDPNDGDLSEASIWATGPYAISYGQNPDTSDGGTPAIDVDYTTLPVANFIDLVLTVEKTTDPLIVPTTAGSQTVYTLVVDTYDFDVDGLDVVDTLPVGWQYVDDSSTITLADHTTISENSADPTITDGGLTLTWDSALLADMADNQTITIEFTAETTQNFATGDITRNLVEASGSRTVGTLYEVTQTFIATDFTFNSYGDPDMEIEKTSNAVDPLNPGDTYT